MGLLDTRVVAEGTLADLLLLADCDYLVAQVQGPMGPWGGLEGAERNSTIAPLSRALPLSPCATAALRHPVA